MTDLTPSTPDGQDPIKTIVVYLPLSWTQISSRTFRSFIEMIRTPVPGHKIEILISDTFPLDRNRNAAVDLCLSSKYNADHIFFADADQIWPKDTIPRLLAHISDEFSIATGIYFRKGGDHRCVAGHYSPLTDDIKMRSASLGEMGFIAPDGSQCLFHRALKDFTTVQPIDVAGMGCVLAKAEVFRKIEQPYFAYVNPYTNGGDYTVAHCSEEMTFWAKCKKSGIKAIVDPSVRCGHVAEVVIGSNEQ